MLQRGMQVCSKDQELDKGKNWILVGRYLSLKLKDRSFVRLAVMAFLIFYLTSEGKMETSHMTLVLLTWRLLLGR